jgi:antitoxin component of RelBE/YafQ-DinJ toxin-antitoxin module
MAATSISLDIDERIQVEAAAILNESGLSITDFLQMSLNRLTLEKSLPQDMMAVLKTRTAKKKSLGDYKASGMWADREDMKDPAKWLEKERNKNCHDC